MGRTELADFIDRGAKKRPQFFGSYIGPIDGDERNEGTCAIGAAFEGITGEPPPDEDEDNVVWETVIGKTGVAEEDLDEIVIINDVLELSRESIAQRLRDRPAPQTLK